MWNGAHKRAAELHTYITKAELPGVQSHMTNQGYMVIKHETTALLVMQHPHYATPLVVSKLGNVLLVTGSGVAHVKKYLAASKEAK